MMATTLRLRRGSAWLRLHVPPTYPGCAINAKEQRQTGGKNIRMRTDRQLQQLAGSDRGLCLPRLVSGIFPPAAPWKSWSLAFTSAGSEEPSTSVPHISSSTCESPPPGTDLLPSSFGATPMLLQPAAPSKFQSCFKAELVEPSVSCPRTISSTCDGPAPPQPPPQKRRETCTHCASTPNRPNRY